MRQMTADQLIEALKSLPPEAPVEIRVRDDDKDVVASLYEVTMEDRKMRCNLGHDHLMGRFVILICEDV